VTFLCKDAADQSGPGTGGRPFAQPLPPAVHHQHPGFASDRSASSLHEAPGATTSRGSDRMPVLSIDIRQPLCAVLTTLDQRTKDDLISPS
jgi:hypothetical protein